jgi:protein PhnA
MSISATLVERSGGICELCGSDSCSHSFFVSHGKVVGIDAEVAVCATCHGHIEGNSGDEHWQCLAGSIWSTVPAVQVMSYRLLHQRESLPWAQEILQSVELEESVMGWAMRAFEKEEVHADSFGVALAHGDTVVLTENLNVKGTSFSAPKGTVVRKIRLVPGNVDQIEGKINDQTIVILTKYVRKSV